MRVFDWSARSSCARCCRAVGRPARFNRRRLSVRGDASSCCSDALDPRIGRPRPPLLFPAHHPSFEDQSNHHPKPNRPGEAVNHPPGSASGPVADKPSYDDSCFPSPVRQRGSRSNRGLLPMAQLAQVSDRATQQPVVESTNVVDRFGGRKGNDSEEGDFVSCGDRCDCGDARLTGGARKRGGRTRGWKHSTDLGGAEALLWIGHRRGAGASCRRPSIGRCAAVDRRG